MSNGISPRNVSVTVTDPSPRGFHADHVRSPGGDPLPRRLGRLLALRVVRGRLARVLALPPGGQLFGGREGVVGAALVDELLRVA